MRYALAYGADAVYAGLPRYSLRVRNNDFLHDNLRTGIEEAHAQGRRFYVAVNVMPHDAKLATFLDDIRPVVEMGPDAFIMADPGLILLVREQWPELPIHLSVQANTMNSASVRFWQRQGISRVILSRELSLEQVEAIRQAVPEMELEVFVHGALCIAYSGRCLLSGYFNHRDANQGTCTNACRWEYQVKGPGEVGEAVGEEAPENVRGRDAEVEPTGKYSRRFSGASSPTAPSEHASERHPAASATWYLEESQRPGEYMPIEEDEQGTYILNSRDLRAVEHVHRLVAMGIDCLKIEGRTKSHYYVAQATRVYRRAIDDALAGRPFDPTLMAELEGLANRGYTDGFFQRHESAELQNYRQGASRSSRAQFVAEVLEAKDGWALVEVKNRFQVGERLELIKPAEVHSFRLEAMQGEDGRPLQVAPGSGWRVRIPLPVEPHPYSLIVRRLEEEEDADGLPRARGAV